MSKILQKPLYLIGFMGSGKSTVSRFLAETLEGKKIEMDDLLAERAGKPITQIFAEDGEEAFRQMETQLLEEIGVGEPAIVSCGGGVVLRPQNVEIMKRTGTILMLSAMPETIYNRVKHSTKRPILNGNMNVEFIAGLMAKRDPAYRAAADVTVSIDGKTSEIVAGEIVEILRAEMTKDK
ncbi:MAG: shikimate kinase [Lachnospiraceae bacterium]|nr:shikimate kinase [Lachnospiraceae bacterium]